MIVPPLLEYTHLLHSHHIDWGFTVRHESSRLAAYIFWGRNEFSAQAPVWIRTMTWIPWFLEFIYIK